MILLVTFVNYLHDLATGFLVASAAGWIVSLRRIADPALAPVRRYFARATLGSLGVVLVLSLPRTYFLFAEDYGPYATWSEIAWLVVKLLPALLVGGFVLRMQWTQSKAKAKAERSEQPGPESKVSGQR